MSDSSGESRDKMRLCPTCRMEISIFATKCRHCGEPVGRPRDEGRKLTIHDLGGMNASDYAPSEEVVGALEAFRQEELEKLNAEEENERTWFKRKKKLDSALNKPSTLGQLDPRNRDLASLKTFNTPRHKRRAEPVLTRKLAFGASFVAAILLLYFGGGFAKARIDDYLAKKNVKAVIQHENAALPVLDSNGPPVKALELAMKELRTSNSEKNKSIADRAREAVKTKVNALLNADPWNVTMLNEASRIMAQTATIDPDDPALKKLQDEVTQERCAYKMTPVRLSPDTGEANLRISLPDNSTEEIVARKNGTAVHSRFLVKNITSKYIRFADPLRKNAAGQPREFILSLDGSLASV